MNRSRRPAAAGVWCAGAVIDQPVLSAGKLAQCGLVFSRHFAPVLRRQVPEPLHGASTSTTRTCLCPMLPRPRVGDPDDRGARPPRARRKLFSLLSVDVESGISPRCASEPQARRLAAGARGKVEHAFPLHPQSWVPSCERFVLELERAGLKELRVLKSTQTFSGRNAQGPTGENAVLFAPTPSDRQSERACRRGRHEACSHEDRPRRAHSSRAFHRAIRVEGPQQLRFEPKRILAADMGRRLACGCALSALRSHRTTPAVHAPRRWNSGRMSSPARLSPAGSRAPVPRPPCSHIRTQARPGGGSTL